VNTLAKYATAVQTIRSMEARLKGETQAAQVQLEPPEVAAILPESKDEL
jgi:hypothetical protein